MTGDGAAWLAEGRRTREWVRVTVPVWSYSQYYLIPDGYLGDHKSIKNEAWNFGLSNWKDGSVIYQVTGWSKDG